MADITKCKGGDCPLKKKCYRYIALSSDYCQSYFKDIPYNYDKKECLDYWGFQENR